jgi:glycosyltransferase involved in cell wall biosynthesis
MISCIVPARNEEDVLERLLDSLKKSAQFCEEDVEIIVVDNGSTDDTKSLIKWPVRYSWYENPSRIEAKNHGAKIAMGEVLVFVDADCKVDNLFFWEILRHAVDSRYIGGGVLRCRYPRMSVGILFFLLACALIFLCYRITVGAFWVRRDVFLEMGGFWERKYDDFNFARRLKKYAIDNGKMTRSLRRTVLFWDTRKFDQHGDWHWLGGYQTRRA